MHQSIGRSLFEVVYGHILIGPLDLVPRATKHQFSGDAETRVKEIRKLHKDVRVKIEKKNKKYQRATNKHRKKVEFKVGDLVWIHLRKERFPQGKCHVPLDLDDHKNEMESPPIFSVRV